MDEQPLRLWNEYKELILSGLRSLEGDIQRMELLVQPIHRVPTIEAELNRLRDQVAAQCAAYATYQQQQADIIANLKTQLGEQRSQTRAVVLFVTAVSSAITAAAAVAYSVINK